jgi:hypothetical protein
LSCIAVRILVRRIRLARSLRPLRTRDLRRSASASVSGDERLDRLHDGGIERPQLNSEAAHRLAIAHHHDLSSQTDLVSVLGMHQHQHAIREHLDVARAEQKCAPELEVAVELVHERSPISE